LIEQAAGHSDGNLDPAFACPDWETALHALVSLARERRFVVVIDEFPRLVAAHAPIASYLQMVWDMALQHTQIFLVLTGSPLSVMRQQVLDPDAPLYLRHTWPFELKPLTVTDLAAFFPDYSPDALVETYAVLGGMPYYVISVDIAPRGRAGMGAYRPLAPVESCAPGGVAASGRGWGMVEQAGTD
jgi:AAA+ ATPase superfamily predicted ATPase